MRDSDDNTPNALQAHRPSRRNDILEAAIRQFARKGLVDTAVTEVAEEANVAATAIYYHFSGKEELFSAAVKRVFQSISDVVAAVRDDDEPATPASLAAVIDAVWNWIDDHPDEATLLYLQLPGTTRQITTLRQEFEDQHAQRAFAYFGGEGPRRTSAARRATETLTVRTLIDLLISVHTMRLADGPLSDEPSTKLRRAVHELADRLMNT